MTEAINVLEGYSTRNRVSYTIDAVMKEVTIKDVKEHLIDGSVVKEEPQPDVVLSPGADISKYAPEVQAVCIGVWTPEVVTANVDAFTKMQQDAFARKMQELASVQNTVEKTIGLNANLQDFNVKLSQVASAMNIALQSLASLQQKINEANQS